MTDVSLPAGRFAPGEFRIGHVLSRALSVFSRNFLTCILVTGIASLPGFVIPFLFPTSQVTPENPFANIYTAIFTMLIAIVLHTLSQAMVLHGAFQVMRDRPFNLAESARIGLHRFFPIIGLGISVAILCWLASILFLIPGIILYVMWFVATPACVVEQLGPFRSMGRSRALTKGHRWKIFGMQLVILIPAFVIGGIITGILLATVGGGGFLAVAQAFSSTLGRVVNLIWNAVWSAFYAITIVVTYHDLRVAKEGIDTEQIAAVFE
jgi:hypothetical protein